MNKKGVGAQAIMILIILFLTIGTTFVFFFWIKGSLAAKTTTLHDTVDIVNQDLLLRNFLRTPVHYNDQNITMAELTIISTRNDDAKNLLNDQAQKIFTPFYDKGYFWHLHISDNADNRIFTYAQKGYEAVLADEITASEQLIPNYIGKNPQAFKIELVKWED